MHDYHVQFVYSVRQCPCALCKCLLTLTPAISLLSNVLAWLSLLGDPDAHATWQCNVDSMLLIIISAISTSLCNTGYTAGFRNLYYIKAFNYYYQLWVSNPTYIVTLYSSRYDYTFRVVCDRRTMPALQNTGVLDKDPGRYRGGGGGVLAGYLLCGIVNAWMALMLASCMM